MRLSTLFRPALLLLSCWLGWFSQQPPSQAQQLAAVASPNSQEKAKQAYVQLPLSFEANAGQFATPVKFAARGTGYTLWLTSAEAVLQMQTSDFETQTAVARPSSASLRLRFVGARPATLTGLEPTASKSHYFTGNDARHWRTNVANFARVKAAEIYPGVDVIWYGNQRQLEYDLLLKPGVQPARIRLALAGAKDIRITEDGAVEARLVGAGERPDDVVLRWLPPVAWQEVQGVRRAVKCAYRLQPSGELTFDLGAYDRSHALVIDPVLSYSTLLGGTGLDEAYAVALDGEGNAYVAGATSSADFPGASQIQAARGGLADVFVAKLNPTGTALVWATWLGGSDLEFPHELALDAGGNVYVAGVTQSPNFPLRNALQSERKGTTDAFVAKLNAAGSALVYSTLLGGAASDEALGLAVDAGGNAYLAGGTNSPDFPTVNALQRERSGAAVYASNDGGANWQAAGGGLRVERVNDLAFDPSATTLYAATERGVFKTANNGMAQFAWTQIGAAQLSQSVWRIAVHPANSQILLAITELLPNRDEELWRSADGGATWTRINILQPPRYLAFDQRATNTVYVGSLNSLFKSTDGGLTFTRLTVRATGEPDPVVLAIAVDPTITETVYVAGPTGVFKSTNGGTSWTFARIIVSGGGTLSLGQLAVSRSNPSVIYALDLSGSLYRSANGGLSWARFPLPPELLINFPQVNIVVDPIDANVVYAGGSALLKTTDGGRTWNTPTNIGGGNPTAIAISPNAPHTIFVGTLSSRDAFLCQLNASGSALTFSTYLGGARDDFAVGVALHATGIYVTGVAGSSDFPRINAYQPNYGGGFSDAFVTKLNPAGGALLWSTFLGGAAQDEARSLALDANGNVFLTGRTFSNNFPTARAVQAANNSTAPFGSDGFISRLSADGQQLVYSTYLGGSESDTANDIALDAAGNVYVTGETLSADFPVVSGLTVNPSNNGTPQAFVTKLNTNGAAWDYSTLLGGNDGADTGEGVAVDAAGNAYVVGHTLASNFPTTPGALRRTGPRDAFVTKLAVSADLALTLNDLPDPVQVNGTLTYTLAVTNNGPDRAANVVVTDTLPSGVTFVSATASVGSCTGTGPVVCNLGNLAGLARATITLVVRPTAAGTLTIRATVTGATADADTNNNSATQETRVVTLPSIFGRVTTANGAALGGVTITLTGAQRPAVVTGNDGSFQFAELPTGANYTVTPSLAGPAFNPPSRTFNNLTTDQRADFSAVPCAFTLSATTQTFTATGGAGSVTLNAPDPQCAWTARSNASWIRLNNANASGIVSGNGSATINFTVEPTVGSRVGSLRIGDNTFIVVQQFYPCATASFPAANVTPSFVQGEVVRARAADFNRDGIPDLAFIMGARSLQTGQVSIILQVFVGRREGGYSAAPSALNFTDGQTTLTDFGAGDLNGDGYPDLAVVGGTGANYRLWLVLSNGASGGFAAPREITLTPQPSSLALGDYNGDNRPDIIVGTYVAEQPVLYLANQGGGNFAAPRALPTSTLSSGVTSLEPADIDGDGKLDLFVFRTVPEVAIYKGDGAGMLTLQPDLIRDPRNGRAIGDFNGDGRPDFAASDYNEVRIWLNDGAGRFPISSSLPLRFPYSASPPGLLAEDFNGDGRSDLLLLTRNTSNEANEGLLFYLATGGGNFGAPVNYLPYVNGRSGRFTMVTSDFTRDGLPDLLLFDYNGVNSTTGLIPIATQPGGTLALQRGLMFSGNQGSTQSSSSPLATADFNGDGALDLAATRSSGGSLGILYGNGRGEFSEPIDVRIEPDNTVNFVLARDFNRDGRPDLAVLRASANELRIMLNDGRGGFTPGASLNVRASFNQLEASDFNNDGALDLVARSATDTGLTVFLNNGQASFTPINVSGFLPDGERFTVGDFNGDGNGDLAFSESGSGDRKLSIALGDGRGAFAAPRSLPLESSLRALTAADVNNDGRTDLLYTLFYSNQLVVLLGNKDGTFAAPRATALGLDVFYLAVADVNGDALPDVLAPGVGNNFVGAVLVLQGRGDGTWETPARLNDFDAPWHVTPADFDNNGTIDLAVARQSSVIGGVLLNQALCVAPRTLVAASAASYARFQAAPESIASLFGANLAATTQSAGSVPLPTQLGGVTVRVRDSAGTERNAPLFFVAPTQINWQVPADLAPGVATISVANGNDLVATGTLKLAPVAPALFAANATGEGVAAALIVRAKADGAQTFEPVARFENNRYVPVPIDLSDPREQVVLLLFGAGLRQRSALENVKASLGLLPATPLYVGTTPGLVGLDQINLPLPRTLAGSGEINVWITVDGRTANPVRIKVR